MKNPIRVLILDDHPGQIDGYRFRLADAEDIEIVEGIGYGEELEPAIEKYQPHVLILDVQVPTSSTNENFYPINHVIPQILQNYPDISILIISMHTQRTLIKSLMSAGAMGYVLKDDQTAFRQLAFIIRTIAEGGIYLSPRAYQEWTRNSAADQQLSSRQLEALSLYSAYPEMTTSVVATRMGIAHSTLRNTLAGAYVKLQVRTRPAAIARARQLGLIPSPYPPPDLSDSDVEE
jgi:DNA-binding NarL/FixJ family response regulator